MNLIYRPSGFHHACIVLGLLLIPALSYSQQQDDYIQTVELIEATAKLNAELRILSETACDQLTASNIEAVIDLRKTLNARKPADANHNDDLEMVVLYAKLSELSKSKPATNLKSDSQNAKIRLGRINGYSRAVESEVDRPWFATFDISRSQTRRNFPIYL